MGSTAAAMLASRLPAAWWAATVCLMATVALGQTPTNGAPAVSQCYSRSGGCKECIRGGSQTDNCGWCPSDPSNKCRPGTALGALYAFSSCYDQGGSPTSASGGPSAGGWAFYENQCCHHIHVRDGDHHLRRNPGNSVPLRRLLLLLQDAAIQRGQGEVKHGQHCHQWPSTEREGTNSVRQRDGNRRCGCVGGNTDPAGRKYYYNPQTEVTSWEKPIKVRRV